MIDLHIKGQFDVPELRRAFMESLAATIAGEPRFPFEPYMINKSDKDWVLDRGNDWRLHFTGDETVRLSYRYARPGEPDDPETALVQWMKYRYGARVIKETVS